MTRIDPIRVARGSLRSNQIGLDRVGTDRVKSDKTELDRIEPSRIGSRAFEDSYVYYEPIGLGQLGLDGVG